MSQVCVRHLPKLAAVHGDRVDLLGGDDREGGGVREGDAPEGGDEDHGAGERRALAGLVHQRPRPHGHHHLSLLHCAQGRSEGSLLPSIIIIIIITIINIINPSCKVHFQRLTTLL